MKNEACRGYGGFGALGHSVYHRELFPRLVEGPWKNDKIKHIATSGTHTAAITEAGFSFNFLHFLFFFPLNFYLFYYLQSLKCGTIVCNH